MPADRCYYFGCWNEAGHFIHGPGGTRVSSGDPACYFGVYHLSLDGTLAPRKRRDRDGGGLCWMGQGATRDDAMKISYQSGEYPQGQYLLHHLDNGYTAIQWWDRNQGDTRGACNSTILLEGKHTSEEMIAALHKHFPHVAANLEKAGVKLVEVPHG